MFTLSDEQNQLRACIKNFVDTEIKPFTLEMDSTGIYPRGLVKRIGNLGYCGLPFKKELGGKGFGSHEGLLFVEELSRGLASLGLIFCAHMFQCSYSLEPFLNKQQLDKWLKPAIKCDKVLAFALSEVSGGSDALGIDTIATRTPDGWVLNGEKVWITNASIADVYIVVARTTPSGRNRDISVFFVDASTPGLDVTGRESLIGLNNSPTGTVRMNDCLIPLDCIIGNENDGYAIINRALNFGRLALSAVAIGVAQDALDEAVIFSRERGNFGRVISTHQGISFLIADMYTNISMARNSLGCVANRTDLGARSTMEIAALKLFSTEMCQEVCKNSALIHGGKGFSKKYNVERLLRDSQMLTTAEGTSQICRIVISNKLYNSYPDTKR